MIYCVEDDDNIRELVIYTLETTGLKARGFADGSAFMEALAFDTPELILLDIMLPGDDGLELLKKLKSSPKTKGIPVIMVTAKGSEYDKVVGLDSGADDYVTKPFGMMELVSRIKAVLRRSGKVEDRMDMETAGVHMDVKKHEVTVDGKAYEVVFDGDSASVNGKRYQVSTAASGAKAEAKPAANTGAGGTVKSPLPGAVLRLSVKEGDRVSEGQEIMVLEAMKMETAVSATASGTVHFAVKQGDQVQTGDTLADIK